MSTGPVTPFERRFAESQISTAPSESSPKLSKLSELLDVAKDVKRAKDLTSLCAAYIRYKSLRDRPKDPGALEELFFADSMGELFAFINKRRKKIVRSGKGSAK